MTSPSAERGQQTRARLLDAAVELIVEIGWGAVTTRKVAERAGLRPGLVHYHFDTVTDLLVDASLRTARREVEQAATMLSKAPDAESGLDEVLGAMAGYTVDDPATVLMSEMLLAARHVERLRAELTTLLTDFRTAFAGWLRAHGGPDDDGATAIVLSAALDGLILHCMIDPDLGSASLVGPLQRLAGLNGGASPKSENDGTSGTGGTTGGDRQSGTDGGS